MLLSALYIGVTFGIYRSSGKIPLTIERLNKYFKCSHNSPKHFFITLKLAPSWRRLGQSLGQSLSHLDHPFTITGHTLSRSQVTPFHDHRTMKSRLEVGCIGRSHCCGVSWYRCTQIKCILQARCLWNQA